MKKFLTLFIAALTAMTSVFFGACSKDGSVTVSVYAPDGAPALAIAKFINDNETFGTARNFEYNVVKESEINNAVLMNKADIVILPLNAATKIYKQSEANTTLADYALGAVITHGNFYLMSKTELSSASDLVGKVVYAPTENKVPDLTLRSALKQAGIEYETTSDGTQAVSGKVVVSFKFAGNVPSINATLISTEAAVGLIPEPAASNLKAQTSGAVDFRLSLQEMYDGETQSYPQAVLMIKRGTAETNAELIGKISAAFDGAVTWAKQNVSDAVAAVKSVYAASTLNEKTLTESAIENCKIYWEGSAAAKNSVNAYIQNIRKIDENAVNVVTDDFFLVNP